MQFNSAIHVAGDWKQPYNFTCNQREGNLSIWQECIPVGCVPSAAVAIGSGGCLPGGVVCIPTCTGAETHFGQNSWHTLVNTLPFRNYVADGKNIEFSNFFGAAFIWESKNIVPTFPACQNSRTFPVFFPFFQYYFNVLFFLTETWSIWVNNTQFI